MPGEILPKSPQSMKAKRPRSSSSHDGDSDDATRKKAKMAEPQHEDERREEEAIRIQPLPAFRFPDSEQVVWSCTSDWDEAEEGSLGWQAQLHVGIKGIVFGPGFDIKDTHLGALTKAPAAFRSDVISIASGRRHDGEVEHTSPEQPGSICQALGGPAILELVRAYPELQNLELVSASALGDEGFMGIIRACPKLRNLCITGIRSRPGGITESGGADCGGTPRPLAC
ncbi:hypothetical protein PG996_013686 [Apiospora saccharicola]|uniref:Uncharacterized protein n=1 Tax=Apiospora saccharicola TaxID=335842 RepID=A0ABR1U679_9PEZI